jgi:hypothetical protein
VEIGCDNVERVRVPFSLDCCDRQAIAFAVATAGISGELVRHVIVHTLPEHFGPECLIHPNGCATTAPVTSLATVDPSPKTRH